MYQLRYFNISLHITNIDTSYLYCYYKTLLFHYKTSIHKKHNLSKQKILKLAFLFISLTHYVSIHVLQYIFTYY